MHSRALKVTFVALALSGVLLVGCKRVVKGNTPITGEIPTTTTTMPAPTTTTTIKMPESASSYSATSTTMSQAPTTSTTMKAAN